MLPKCTVLGAGGFIGSNLVAFLKKKGHWVRAVDIQFPDFRKELWSQADERVVSDLRNEASYPGAIIYSDWVFQLAADMGGVGYITDDNVEAAESSHLINLKVLEASKKHRVKRLFFSSSACIYPVELQEGVDEWRRYRLSEEDMFKAGHADNPYGWEKRHMTQMCEQNRKAGKLDARVGIFHSIYGPYSDFEGPRMKFPAAVTRKIIECEKEPIPEVEIWGNGKQIRTFLYISDCLEKIYSIMTNKYYGPVNVANEEELTVDETAQLVGEIAGIKPKLIHLPHKPAGVQARGVNNSKWDAQYPYRNQVPSKEGFRLLYDYMLSELK